MDILKLFLFIPVIGLTTGIAFLAAHIAREAFADPDGFNIGFAIFWPCLAGTWVVFAWLGVLGLNGLGPFTNFLN